MERGFYADLEFLQGSTMCLDLHDMSDGAAEAAVRWWLDERSTGCATQRLDVITGWGKSRPVYKDSDIRATVGKLLDDLEVPQLPTSNPGVLSVDLARYTQEVLEKTITRADLSEEGQQLYDELTVEGLKAKLREAKQKASGRKAELADRLSKLSM